MTLTKTVFVISLTLSVALACVGRIKSPLAAPQAAAPVADVPLSPEGTPLDTQPILPRHQGLVPDDVSILNRQSIKLIYLQPTFPDDGRPTLDRHLEDDKPGCPTSILDQRISRPVRFFLKKRSMVFRKPTFASPTVVTKNRGRRILTRKPARTCALWISSLARYAWF